MSQLSVIIPVKNGMPYLPRSISSKPRAVPRESERLVLDDGSTHGTAVFLAGVKDNQLKVFRNESQQASPVPKPGCWAMPGQLFPDGPTLGTFAHLVHESRKLGKR